MKNYYPKFKTMKKTTVVFGMICFIGISSYLMNIWWSSQPTPSNFDKVLQQMWDRRDIFTDNAFGGFPDKYGVGLPKSSTLDPYSKPINPMAWHYDIINTIPLQSTDEIQANRLDSLCDLGFLQKKNVHNIVINNKPTVVTRYSRTDKGWINDGFYEHSSKYSGISIIYCTVRYGGVSRVINMKPYRYNLSKQKEVYEVVAKIDIELTDWAKNPRIQELFPEIKKYGYNRECTFTMTRKNGEWVDYYRNQAMGNPIFSYPIKNILHTYIHYYKNQLINRFIRLITKPLPDPTIREIKEILLAKDWPKLELELLSNKLPVDIYDHSKHTITIFTNKFRVSNDPVINKTLPYLEILVESGVFIKKEINNIPGTGKESGSLFNALIFELNPAYIDRIDNNGRFKLGIPSIDFVDISISESKDRFGFSVPSVNYKYKVRFKNPPEWALDPSLLNKWDELRGIIENGIACEGEYIDYIKYRKKWSSMNGTCMPAYDSIYDSD